MGAMKSICSNCRHVMRHDDYGNLPSDLWRCAAGTDIDPVSGGPEEEYCEDKNEYGQCQDFFSVKVTKPDPIDDLLEALEDPPAPKREPWWLPILKWIMG